jgi:hypothetical protein
MRTQQLLSRDTWPTLTLMTTEAGEISAAIAYVTANLLKLKRDDILVCDASDESIKGGRTDAKLLARLVKAKVKVLSIKGVHVKMGVFDKYAFIGSANMSARAGERSLEATLLTTDTQVRSMVSAHIAQLVRMAVLVDTAFIERIVNLPVSRRRGPEPEYDGPKQEDPGRPVQAWWLSSAPLGSRGLRALENRMPIVTEQAISQLGTDSDDSVRRAATQWARDPDAIKLVVYPAKNRIPRALQRGDSIIFCHRHEPGNYMVAAPVTFLATVIAGDHQHVIYLPSPKTVTKKWSTVEPRLRKLGSSTKPTSNRVLRGLEEHICDYLAGG